MERIFRCTNGVSFGAKYTVQDTDIGASAVAEVIKLTVTDGAIADGTVDIVLRSADPVSISVQSSDDTLEEIATQIASGTYPGWTASATGAVVTFTAEAEEAKEGINSITGGDTEVDGTFDITTPGVDAENAVVGVAEVIKLTVTEAASASGNVSISIRGATAVDIAVLDTDDLAGIATKIAAGSFAGWSAASSGAVVTFTADNAGVKTGANAIDGGNTDVTGTFEITTSGVDAKDAVVGVAEVIELTVTDGAIADGTVDIVLRNANPVSISVQSSDDTADEVATKIAAGTYPGWTASATGAVVTFTAAVAGVKTGTNTFDGGTTGVEAGIVVDTVGSAATDGSVTFVFKGSGDGAVAYPLAASILVLKANVVKSLGDAVITFPANGTVKIADGSSFTLEKDDVIVVAAQRADIVAE